MLKSDMLTDGKPLKVITDNDEHHSESWPKYLAYPFEVS